MNMKTVFIIPMFILLSSCTTIDGKGDYSQVSKTQNHIYTHEKEQGVENFTLPRLTERTVTEIKARIVQVPTNIEKQRVQKSDVTQAFITYYKNIIGSQEEVTFKGFYDTLLKIAKEKPSQLTAQTVHEFFPNMLLEDVQILIDFLNQNANLELDYFFYAARKAMGKESTMDYYSLSLQDSEITNISNISYDQLTFSTDINTATLPEETKTLPIPEHCVNVFVRDGYLTHQLTQKNFYSAVINAHNYEIGYVLSCSYEAPVSSIKYYTIFLENGKKTGRLHSGRIDSVKYVGRLSAVRDLCLGTDNTDYFEHFALVFLEDGRSFTTPIIRVLLEPYFPCAPKKEEPVSKYR